jgi:hypothetical protein
VSSEQVQISTEEKDFSDIAVKSRELQQEDLEIKDRNIKVQKNLSVVDSGKKIRLNDRTKRSYNTEDVHINKQDIINTIDRKQNDIFTYDDSYIRIANVKELQKNINRNYVGIIKEENGVEYLYPCEINYILKIDVDNPIIEDTYYIERESSSRINKIKRKITSSDTTYLRAESDEIYLDMVDKRKKNRSPAYMNALTVSTFIWWCFLCVASTLFVGISFLFFVYLILAIFSGMILFNSTKRDSTIKKHNKEYVKPLYNLDIDISNVLNSYFEDKKCVKEVEFSVEKDYKIKAETIDGDTSWTLNKTGITPQRVTDFIEDEGFDKIEDPIYNIQIAPRNSIKDPKSYLISDCGEWYLCLD